MQNPINVLQEVSELLQSAGIEYYLVGSLASMHYGRPRFTNDIDLVVQIKASQIQKFEAVFNTESFYCPPIEVIRDEVLRGGMFNLIHQASGVKVDIVPKKKTPFAEAEFSRRKKVEILPGISIYLASPEDLIIKKLEYFREGGSEKHVQDIRGMIAETTLDHDYLEEWIELLGLKKQWQEIQ